MTDDDKECWPIWFALAGVPMIALIIWGEEAAGIASAITWIGTFGGMAIYDKIQHHLAYRAWKAERTPS